MPKQKCWRSFKQFYRQWLIFMIVFFLFFLMLLFSVCVYVILSFDEKYISIIFIYFEKLCQVLFWFWTDGISSSRTNNSCFWFLPVYFFHKSSNINNCLIQKTYFSWKPYDIQQYFFNLTVNGVASLWPAVFREKKKQVQ